MTVVAVSCWLTSDWYLKHFLPFWAKGVRQQAYSMCDATGNDRTAKAYQGEGKKEKMLTPKLPSSPPHFIINVQVRASKDFLQVLAERE